MIRPLARGPASPPVLAVLAVALAAGCGSRATLDHTLESPEAVARAVVRALNSRDANALRDLALTEREFREVVWPRLPGSRPERNLPWDFVWKDLAAKSRQTLRARLNEWQDRGFRVVAVRYAGASTDYSAFRVHREAEVTLRDRTGQETTGRLFGSLIEQHGRYKVFSYVTK
jgi:hypothetical protein